VKTFLRRDGKVILRPANAAFTDIVLDPAEVTVFGRVVTVMRRL
jgi:repressor LexA